MRQWMVDPKVLCRNHLLGELWTLQCGVELKDVTYTKGMNVFTGKQIQLEINIVGGNK